MLSSSLSGTKKYKSALRYKQTLRKNTQYDMEMGNFVSCELLMSYVPITNNYYICIYFWLKEINLSVSLKDACCSHSENCSAIFQASEM